ncbi:cell wall anchored [Colletotrichum higginsianum]|nr:cell wall anchored [Colletotrichum higginsianum]
MVHVPVGEKGIIVNIGGQATRDPTPYGVRVQNANAGNVNINLSFVDIYDIETGFWFRQETFGLPDIPAGRSDICAVVVPAADASSYNIYMIAGVENYATAITSEEVWVLTLPTFSWILVHTRADGMYGHTCHAVGENLLLVGGMQTRNDGSGGNVNTCADHMPVEVFSLATQNYTGRYDARAAQRLAPVPSQVVAAVGGTASGGANLRAPRAWSDVYLQYIFDPSLIRPKYTPGYTLVPGILDSPTSPVHHVHPAHAYAAELEVPGNASEMPSSPRYGGSSVEMDSEVTQSPRAGDGGLDPGGDGTWGCRERLGEGK